MLTKIGGRGRHKIAPNVCNNLFSTEFAMTTVIDGKGSNKPNRLRQYHFVWKLLLQGIIRNKNGSTITEAEATVQIGNWLSNAGKAKNPGDVVEKRLNSQILAEIEAMKP